jgi:hypothetical protein
MQSPKSENTVFCILLDDRELDISFASADEAEVTAQGLFNTDTRKSRSSISSLVSLCGMSLTYGRRRES